MAKPLRETGVAAAGQRQQVPPPIVVRRPERPFDPMLNDRLMHDQDAVAQQAKANNWRVTTVKTPSNGELVLVMSDGTRETWTRAPAD